MTINLNEINDMARLTRALVIADNLTREGEIRFNTDRPETATIGPVQSSREIAPKALVTALALCDLPVTQDTESRIGTSPLCACFGSNARGASRPQMIAALREILTPPIPH